MREIHNHKMRHGDYGLQRGHDRGERLRRQENPIEAKRSIGYVSDSHVVYDQLTGAEYVDFMASIYGVADKESYKSRLENYIDVFGLKDAFNEPIKSYSHGMQQKSTSSARLSTIRRY